MPFAPATPDLSRHTRFQAEHHPLVFTGSFSSLTDYCLHLVHLKSYEEAASFAAGKVVLDLGCNNGYGTAVIGNACDRICGLDVSTTAIDDARQRYGDRGIDFRVYDGRVIPFDSGSFDLIVSFQVIEHIENITPYLTEIARVLRPGGTALFTTPNAGIRLDPGMKPWNEFHVREYRAEELAAALWPIFSEVSVRGLFAVKDLYQIEFERCQSALRNARDGNSGGHASLAKQLRDRGVQLIKTLLPASTVNYIKSRRNHIPPAAAAAEQTLDAAIMNKYSTRDLFYRSDNMGQALDLLAVCKAP